MLFGMVRRNAPYRSPCERSSQGWRWLLHSLWSRLHTQQRIPAAQLAAIIALPSPVRAQRTPYHSPLPGAMAGVWCAAMTCWFNCRRRSTACKAARSSPPCITHHVVQVWRRRRLGTASCGTSATSHRVIVHLHTAVLSTQMMARATGPSYSKVDSPCACSTYPCNTRIVVGIQNGAPAVGSC